MSLPPTGGGDTIFALSSGPPPAAIAVVRVSGPRAGEALVRLAGRLPSPRRATLGVLRDSRGDTLDRALLLWMPGEATATGEPLAELHLHGGRGTVAAVLRELAAMSGLRGAEPGEFTRRALERGRIDLAQAEGLADLLAAETEGQRRAALRVAEGGLGRLVEGWRERLLALSAAVEASIEFAEEHEDAAMAERSIGPDAAALLLDFEEALAAPPAERLHDGIRVVIAGPVNAGKSTLLNALCGRDAAITAPLAGTTRDVIEVPVVLDGMACVLIDVAGMRDTDDPVERIGIERAWRAVSAADLLLWLGDPSDCPDMCSRLIVHARADLPGRGSMPQGADLSVSVETGSGMAELRKRIGNHCGMLVPAPSAVSLNQRHRHLVEEASGELRAAATASDEVLAAEHVRSARVSLDRIVGRVDHEDMLDALFGRFCIGK